MTPMSRRKDGRGRQPLPIEERRICQVQTNLTVAEREAVQAYADRMNVVTADLIRQLLLGAAAAA